MKKGMAVVQLIAAVIILLFTVWVTWAFVYGSDIPKPSSSSQSDTQTQSQETCISNSDCLTNPYGSACLSIYNPNNPGPLSYSCECLTKDDCQSTSDVQRGDTCGDNNRCA